MENLARSPTSRFATNVVALSLYLWTPWNLGLLHIFLLHIIALLPKGLGTRHVNVDLASVKGLRPAFVSFFLTKVDKRLYNSLWS